MAKFKPQYRRLLFIDRKIREGGYPNCAGLAAEWETSARTIHRDIDYLKYELDAPVAYDAGRRGYFYTDSTWFVPSFILTENDLLTLLIGEQAMKMYYGTPIANDLRRIYARMASLLPDQLSGGIKDLGSCFSFFYPPARPIEPTVWHATLNAILKSRALDVKYVAAGSRKTMKERLHPYHIVNLEGEWYMLAYSQRERKIKPWAFSRMKEVALTDSVYDVKSNYDVVKILHREFGHHFQFSRDGAGKKVAVKLLFDPAFTPYVRDKVWHPEQSLKEHADGAVELLIPVPDTKSIESWILSLGEYVTVLSPRSLKETIRNRHLSAAERPRG